MMVIGIGDLQMVNDREKFPGIIIQASREELQAVAGNILYKKVEVAPVEKRTGKGYDFWGNVMECFVKRLCDVDQRVRTAKASRRYSRAEVLAMLDEIDPGIEGKGGAECQS